MKDSVENFLAAETYAVVGASSNRAKFGNRVFRAILASGRHASPINPTASQVEGHTAYASIADLPVVPDSISIITPPHITREIVADAITAGVKNIWMQPGAQDDDASQSARAAGLNVIDDGSCILVLLGQQA
jgi:predicted CoA-binding protein